MKKPIKQSPQSELEKIIFDFIDASPEEIDMNVAVDYLNEYHSAINTVYFLLANAVSEENHAHELSEFQLKNLPFFLNRYSKLISNLVRYYSGRKEATHA